MEPTIAELIFWIIVGVPCVGMLIAMMGAKSDTIDITPSKRRDWERREKEWYK